MKNIEIKFPNGDIYHLPTNVIAEMRTEYYSDIDGFKKGSKEWDEEYEQSMKGYELIDWIQNNVNFKDISNKLIKINNNIEPNYSEMWFDAEFVIK